MCAVVCKKVHQFLLPFSIQKSAEIGVNIPFYRAKSAKIRAVKGFDRIKIGANFPPWLKTEIFYNFFKNFFSTFLNGICNFWNFFFFFEKNHVLVPNESCSSNDTLKFFYGCKKVWKKCEIFLKFQKYMGQSKKCQKLP